jgi:SNF2 family DNA or RNA helicase
LFHFCDAIESRQASRVLDAIKDNSNGGANMLAMLMKLRLACNHPYLALKAINSQSIASQLASAFESAKKTKKNSNAFILFHVFRVFFLKKNL